MTTRLTGGVIPAAHERVWPLGSADVESGTAGQAVAVGPGDAAEEQVRAALERLGRLVARGGVVAADAGVELGSGFRSARVEGGAGNRRDGMLAALRVVGAGPDREPAVGSGGGPPAAGSWGGSPAADSGGGSPAAGSWGGSPAAGSGGGPLGAGSGGGSLGAPGAISVALFGIEATKPLGAAATAAVAGGRWAALRFAVAAAEVLGPEQLVELLQVEAGDVDPFPDGLPSVVGEHLRRVLEPLPRARRAALLADLWAGVCAHQEEQHRRARRLATQAKIDRLADLRNRFDRYDDDEIVEAVRRTLGKAPTLADAARWAWPTWYRHQVADVALHDCLGATVLLRLAVSVADFGVGEALRRHRDEIAAGAALLDDGRAGRAGRHVAGLTGLPARPGVILRALARKTAGDEAFVRNAVANARAYGRLAHENAVELLRLMVDAAPGNARDDAEQWAGRDMGAWREKVGLFSPDRPGQWQQPPLFGAEPGAERVQGEPGAERIGDMLWLADLGDALAQLNWGSAALVEYGRIPDVVFDLPQPEESPLAPRWESIALVAGGTAQLAGLAGLRAGGIVPAAVRKARTWRELIAALQGEAAVSEALTGSFAVPEAVLATDGTPLPGGDEVIEIARTPRQTAEWGAYMGNCIGGPWYTDAALAGKAFLVAVRDVDGRILANVDLHPSARGWRIDELQARFNQDPEPALAERIRAWVVTLPPPRVPGPPVEDLAPETGSGRRRHRQTPAARIAAEHKAALGSRAAAVLGGPETVAALEVLARLASGAADVAGTAGTAGTGGTGGTRGAAGAGGTRGAAGTGGAGGDDLAAMTALRRVSAGALTRALAEALESGRLTAGQAWRAGGARPMSAALTEYDETLGTLALDEPLAGSLRTVARAPGIAEARTTELVARRVRRAMGALLRSGSPALVARRPEGLDAPMLCACTLALTTWSGPGLPVVQPRRITVPGFPASTLNDEAGPWVQAWPDAIELGADRDAFWDHIAEHGLLAPPAWLEPAGWPALWALAHRT